MSINYYLMFSKLFYHIEKRKNRKNFIEIKKKQKNFILLNKQEKYDHTINIRKVEAPTCSFR